MRHADARLHSIGTTFAVQYYTTLVQCPDQLAAFYSANAHVMHCFKKAKGAAEISALLATLIATNVTEVRLGDVSTTRTPAGSIKASITACLISKGLEQAITQEVELREVVADTFAITSDALTYVLAPDEAPCRWTEETPVLTAVPAPVNLEGVDPQTHQEEEEEAAASAAVFAAASSEVVEPVPVEAENEEEEKDKALLSAMEKKRPRSFAEVARLKKDAPTVDFAKPAKRVVAHGRPEEAAEKKVAATSKHAKKSEEVEGKKAPITATATAAAPALVFYDVILKDLRTTITEEEVRGLVTPVAAVKRVQIVHSEKRRRPKESAEAAEKAAPTFAFVQLLRSAEAAPSFVADVVAQLATLHKDTAIAVEQVRERRAPVKRPHTSSHGNNHNSNGPRKTERPAGSAPSKAVPQRTWI